MGDLSDRDNWFKALAVVGPLFASTLAISYDVGFFYGADIGFFTFFSLTEHVVFALQAIPFALVPAFIIIVFIAITWFGYYDIVKTIKDTVVKVQQMGPEERETFIAKLRRRAWRYKSFDPFVHGGVLLVAIWNFTNHHYTVAFLILVSQVVAKMIYPIDRWESKTFRYLLALFCVSTGWATAFSVGYERSEATMLSGVANELIFSEGKEIPARLIRGGERGVLFKSLETGKLSFLRWETIKRIDSF